MKRRADRLGKTIPQLLADDQAAFRDSDYLRRLDFPTKVVDEVEQAQMNGLFDMKPSPNLLARLRNLLGIAFVGAMLTYSAAADTTSITIDLKKIDPALASQILESQKKLDISNPKTVLDQTQEWAGVGKAAGDAIGATAKALSFEVNDFVNTPVGKWAFFFLFWYVIGHKIWAVFAGTIIWIVLGSVIWRSFSIFHRPKIVIVDGKAQSILYSFSSNDAKVGSAIVHAIAFVVLSFVMMLVIL